MSVQNASMQEIFVSFFERYNQILTNPLVIENGWTRPPDGPGWGTEINEEALVEFPPGDFLQVESEPYLEF